MPSRGKQAPVTVGSVEESLKDSLGDSGQATVWLLWLQHGPFQNGASRGLSHLLLPTGGAASQAEDLSKESYWMCRMWQDWEAAL